MAWTGYLTQDELRAVRETLIAADLFQPEVFGALLAILPRTYLSGLPANAGLPPKLRIDSTLGQMNGVVNLRGGEVPLRLVLTLAADLAADAGHRDLLEDMVDKVDARRPELDLIRVQDIGLSNADDPTVLAWAATDGRVLLTGRAQVHDDEGE